MKQLSFYIILFLLAFFNVKAQNFDKIQAEYLLAKQYYYDGNYYNAKVGMQKIAFEYKKNAFTEYAQYYMALCAAKQKQYDDALELLLKLKSNAKKWNKDDDLNYQLGVLYFEKNDPLNALQAFSEVSKKSIYQKNMSYAKENSLNKINDINLLKTCYGFYSSDTSVAKVAYFKLIKNAATINDATEIDKKHHFSKNQMAVTETKSNIQTDATKTVAILLPFMLNDVDFTTPNREVQFVYDYFEGFKVGLDSLKQAGINVDFITFDTKKDSAEINKILKLNDFKSFDAVIGPAYNFQIKYFSKRFNYDIPIIVPFSKNLITQELENTVFLAEPSFETQAKKLALYSLDSIEPQNASIIYGGSNRDSIMAYNYKKEYENHGGKIDLMIKIHKMDFTQSILAIKKVDYTTTGHVAFFASDESIARNFISVVDMRNTTMPIVAYADLLEYQSIALEQFEKRFFRFVHTDYFDYENPIYLNFKKNYAYKMGVLPSIYCYKGFEHAFLVAKSNLKNLENSTLINGILFTGFEYTGKRDNQVVQLTKLQNLVLKPINYIPNKN